MIPLLAASLLLGTQGGVLPKPPSKTVPNEVRDWSGFKFLPSGPRTVPNAFPAPADGSGTKADVRPEATVWRTKVVILDRIDRTHERGKDLVWTGHHGANPPLVAVVRRALPQLAARVADETGGAVDLRFDVAEEPEALTIQGGDLPAAVRRYLAPRLNGGRYDAEDGLFRGPYSSVIVVHPVGGESSAPIEVQGAPTALVGLPDVEGYDVDGVLATALLDRWHGLAALRGRQAGLPFSIDPKVWKDWNALAPGLDVPTEVSLRLRAAPGQASSSKAPGGPRPFARGGVGQGTFLKIVKDPERGSVLQYDEASAFRSGGFAVPWVNGWTLDPSKTPTLCFWMKSDSKDPIVLQISTTSVSVGVDVPFAYDGAWHRVKVDLRPIAKGVSTLLIGPDEAARKAFRRTLGPITAQFSDFEATTEAPDRKPTPEAPSPTAVDPEARARWAKDAGPGEERRALLKDPVEGVRANAAAAALARPDPADEPALLEDALFNFEPTVFEPALRALGNLKTPTADMALRQAMRSAAAERARGFAAEVLAGSGDSKLVPLMVGLNQARTRATRIAAIHALGSLPGSEAALMRMAYLPQNDPETKLEATLTADPNDDFQARKLLWSAVNEPSDAVRLESLRRLSTSTVPEFREEGLKGVRDDSVGVRVGLLEAWSATPAAATLPAIRIALADASPRVRAAALAALAANPATVEAKDVPFDDPDPRVRLAALRLAKAKGIALPAP